jgi:hypothetical protein
MSIAKQWVSGPMNYADRACFYNSALDGPETDSANAKLTICLRISLTKLSAPAQGGKWRKTFDVCGHHIEQEVDVREWGTTEWQLFEQECWFSARFWDFRFYLSLPGATPGWT